MVSRVALLLLQHLLQQLQLPPPSAAATLSAAAAAAAATAAAAAVLLMRTTRYNAVRDLPFPTTSPDTPPPKICFRILDRIWMNYRNGPGGLQNSGNIQKKITPESMDIITAKKIYLSYSMLPYIKGTINDKLNYPQKPIFGYRIPLREVFSTSYIPITKKILVLIHV